MLYVFYITTTPYLPCNNKNINRKELYDFYYTATQPKIHGPVSGRGENQLNTGRNTGLYPDVIAHVLLTSWKPRPVSARRSTSWIQPVNTGCIQPVPPTSCLQPVQLVCAHAQREMSLSYAAKIHQETEKVLQFDLLFQLQLQGIIIKSRIDYQGQDSKRERERERERERK